MKDSEFVFNYVQSLYYKCHKINLNRGGSYVDSREQIKQEKASISPINKKDNKCFQYVVTVARNPEEIKKDLQKITKTKPFRNRFNWKEINFPSEKDDLKKFEKNNVTIARNVLYAKKEKIILLMFQNITHILLMISNAVKRERSKTFDTQAKSKEHKAKFD